MQYRNLKPSKYTLKYMLQLCYKVVIMTRIPRKCLIVAVACNVIALVLLNIRLQQLPQEPGALTVPNKTPSKLTVILQDFELFENSLYKTIHAMASNFSEIDILVLSEKIPYPPILIPELTNVKFVVTRPSIGNMFNDTRPESHIRSDFVLFVPDGVVINKIFMNKFANLVIKLDMNRREVFAIPVESANLKCHSLNFSVQTWTLEFGNILNSKPCRYISGDHGLLFRTRHFYLLSNPFLKPTFLSMYIQLSLTNFTIVVQDDLHLGRISRLFQSPENLWQYKKSQAVKVKELYAELGIKLVVRENKQKEWFGCTKDSARCFDTVYNDMPEYLYNGRWTPPCCLKHLQETAKHVFDILDKCQVRYWLEGGSLLGAARHGDIIPWDYDIDIGIYQKDIIKCISLSQMFGKPFIDTDGYSWEKAVEGDFYRVQFSEFNHLHVDIFPFYSKNGIMTKDTWFKNHRQDTEFPEHFLQPLTRISFAGLNASAPNNVRDFLEYKFGKGVIENPRYPDARIIV